MDTKIIALILLVAIGLGAIVFILPDSPDNNQEIIEKRDSIEENVKPPENKPEEIEEKVDEVEEKVDDEILSGQVDIVLDNLQFNPSVITIKKGTTVTWKNVDRTIGGSGGAVGWHNVVEGPVGKRGDHIFKSSELNVNAGFSYKFEEVGEFVYHCQPHPTMTAKIIVVD